MSFAVFSLLSFGCIDAGLALGPAALVVASPVAAAQEPVRPDRGSASPARDTGEPLAFAGESDEAVVERIRRYIEGITTLKGEFTQTAPSGAVSDGRFYLRRPGLLRFEYDPPSPLLIVATGGLVFVRDESLETTDSYPIGKTPLKFLLKKRVELGDAKVLAVDRGVRSVAVTFAAGDDEDAGDLSVILRAPDLELRQWIVRDSQNGVTVVTLENLVAGAPLENRLFAAPETGSAFLKD